jgi:predicted DNA-binding transcriptional regulator YafY
MTRLARLTRILLQLQSRRIVTSGELARKFGISQRTVYRDIKTLEDSGVPVIGRVGNGYYLQEDYRMPPVMFTEPEVHALLTAREYFSANPDRSVSENIESLVVKVKALLKYSAKEKAERLEQRVRVYESEEKLKTNYLSTIQSAIANYTLIDMEYHAISSDSISQREVEPLAIYYTKDKWLLIGYCRMREALREFRIDRILKLGVTKNQFTERHFSFEEYISQALKNS